MAIFIITPNHQSQKRPDGKNFVVSAVDANAAKTTAEGLVGQPTGAFISWKAVELSDATTDFVFESANGPVGRRAESVFSPLSRGGDFLKA